MMTVIARAYTEKSEKESKVLTTDATEPDVPLQCWNCTTTDPNHDCFGLADLNGTDPLPLPGAPFKQNCSKEDTFCQVKRNWIITTKKDGVKEEKNFSITRSCTRTCDDFCIVLGDRTKIHSCQSCCTTPNCNTGNIGTSSITRHIRAQSLLILTAAIMTTFTASLTQC